MAREQDLVRAILNYLESIGVLAWRQNQGAFKEKSRFIRFTSITGISDIIAVVPPDGRLLAIECKVGRNKATDAQEDFLAAVNRSGGIAIVARCLEDVERALTDAGWMPPFQL